MKSITYIIIMILLSGCSGNTQNMIDKAKNTPEIKAMQETFSKQENRIEINDCEVIYNGNSFFLDSTLEHLKTFLGEPDYNELYGYAWSSKGIIITKNKNDDSLRSIYIYISQNFKDVVNANDDIILVNSIPLNRQMDFAELINNSSYEFDDFEITKHSYDLIKDSCENESSKIKISFASPVPFDYSGGGHLQIRGDFRPDLTHPVDRISIYRTDK